MDGANNFPLRGGKLSDFEGGVRVNAFISGGALPSSLRGTKRDGTIAIADLHATICTLAGVPIPDTAPLAAKLPPVDGVDMLPYLMAETPKSPRTEIPLSCLSGSTIFPGDNRDKARVLVWTGGALIVGSHKLIYGTQLGMGYLQGPSYPNETLVPSSLAGLPTAGKRCGIPLAEGSNGLRPCLFDIRSDPTESHDLMEDPSPEVKELLRKMETKYANYCKGFFQSTHIFANEEHNEHPKCQSVPEYAAGHRGFRGPLCT